ncbi:hypothetical protein KUV56_08255 [Ferrimonas balearica]|uniref:hypothetical protein n=1 Tax=Ferrimonas balearica TaxID=44012 RepID=UPI001C55E83C|nr:hypothetical protein [Ferrimonas balearica]MBW3139505.1 hypothetical protein [Ferrimonas balearica]
MGIDVEQRPQNIPMSDHLISQDRIMPVFAATLFVQSNIGATEKVRFIGGLMEFGEAYSTQGGTKSTGDFLTSRIGCTSA